MPIVSKAKHYKPSEIEFSQISELAYQIFKNQPFQWQLDTAKAVLMGKDTILDVGTGSGKTLCFSLLLLLEKYDIALTISPLTALMIEQAKASPISTVAVCSEILSLLGSEKLYEEIAKGNFRHIFVSPEIVISADFYRGVI